MTGVESKRDKFVRLAESRTNSVMERLRVLGNLSNTYVYDFDEDLVEKVFTAIEESVEEERKKFDEQLRRRREREHDDSVPARRKFELVA